MRMLCAFFYDLVTTDGDLWWVLRQKNYKIEVALERELAIEYDMREIREEIEKYKRMLEENKKIMKENDRVMKEKEIENQRLRQEIERLMSKNGD